MKAARLRKKGTIKSHFFVVDRVGRCLKGAEMQESPIIVGIRLLYHRLTVSPTEVGLLTYWPLVSANSAERLAYDDH